MDKKPDSIQNPEENGGIEEPSVEDQLKKAQEEKEALLQTKDNLVSELQELRKKKQEVEKEKDELEKSKTETPTEQPDVLKVVEEIFNKKEQEAREKSRIKAMNNFIAKHPELSDANDEAGLKKSAFERKLAMFNTSALEDESEFISIYETAYSLLGNKIEDEGGNANVVTPPITNIPPTTEDPNNLSDKEMNYINIHLGGDKERFMALKSKMHPDALKNLLQG